MTDSEIKEALIDQHWFSLKRSYAGWTKRQSTGLIDKPRMLKKEIIGFVHACAILGFKGLIM